MRQRGLRMGFLARIKTPIFCVGLPPRRIPIQAASRAGEMRQLEL
jgi:hypothetical protein